MRIIVMVIMLLVMVGLFANAGRQTYLWIKLIFRGLNQLLYGLVFGVAVSVKPPITPNAGLKIIPNTHAERIVCDWTKRLILIHIYESLRFLV